MGHNSVKYLLIRSSTSCTQTVCQISWSLPSSCSSPNILFTQLLYYTKHKSWKRDISQSNNNRTLLKVNQVIYILDKNCVPNIMIIFYRILRKVNQAICIMYPNCMPDIMILAQAVLQVFCWQDYFAIQDAKVRKIGHNSVKYICTEFFQKLIRSSTPCTQSECQISWS